MIIMNGNPPPKSGILHEARRQRACLSLDESANENWFSVVFLPFPLLLVCRLNRYPLVGFAFWEFELCCCLKSQYRPGCIKEIGRNWGAFVKAPNPGEWLARVHVRPKACSFESGFGFGLWIWIWIDNEVCDLVCESGHSMWAIDWTAASTIEWSNDQMNEWVNE